MSRGLPVICARASAVPEVAGDAALYFDPTRSDELASAVERVLTDGELAERLRTAGRRRAAGFTWRRAAEQTLDVYDRAVRER
jgi:glycosyltransferase involved in cell wall biosynthesis